MTDYDILQLNAITIGEGTFSKVVAVKDVNNKQIACKILRKGPKVIKEVKILKKLNHPTHPNIVEFYDYVEDVKDSQHSHILMEFIEGVDLATFIDNNNSLDIQDVQHMFRQIVLAVDHCHNVGVAHRDLKLDNIMITNTINNRLHVKLIDFGLSDFIHIRSVDNTDNKQIKLFENSCGTVEYAAPELLLEICYNGISADVYALGVILYAMTHKKFPFNKVKGDKSAIMHLILSMPPVTSHSLDKDCVQLIHWLMHKKPKMRPSIKQIKQSQFYQKTFNLPNT